MATLWHRIKAWLYDNRLTQDNPDDFIARVASERTLSVGDICGSAAARGGADIPALAMEHAVTLFLAEMGYQLCDGFAVNTGWFTAGIHIKGTFESPAETFEPKKHTLVFEFHKGALLRRSAGRLHRTVQGVCTERCRVSALSGAGCLHRAVQVGCTPQEHAGM